MGNYAFEHLNSINVPANTFFHSQMKKTLSKATTTTTFSSEAIRKKHKEQRIKNKRLSDYIYSNANL